MTIFGIAPHLHVRDAKNAFYYFCLLISKDAMACAFVLSSLQYAASRPIKRSLHTFFHTFFCFFVFVILWLNSMPRKLPKSRNWRPTRDEKAKKKSYRSLQIDIGKCFIEIKRKKVDEVFVLLLVVANDVSNSLELCWHL